MSCGPSYLLEVHHKYKCWKCGDECTICELWQTFLLGGHELEEERRITTQFREVFSRSNSNWRIKDGNTSFYIIRCKCGTKLQSIHITASKLEANQGWL